MVSVKNVPSSCKLLKMAKVAGLNNATSERVKMRRENAQLVQPMRELKTLLKEKEVNVVLINAKQIKSCFKMASASIVVLTQKSQTMAKLVRKWYVEKEKSFCSQGSVRSVQSITMSQPRTRRNVY